MQPLLYGDLIAWYDLVDPAADHREEAECFQAAIERVVTPPAQTLLELGSGAGHNALHLKRRFQCTLSDISEPMLQLSHALNPECEHTHADMRTLRLERCFDAVLLHDAVVYMTSEDDLLAAARTAFVHTRPGGAAIFAPDCVRETFHEHTELLAQTQGQRALRGLMWSWDPDPSDHTYAVEFGFLVRDRDRVEAFHDRHVHGVFSRATWFRLLASTGYEVGTMQRPLGDGAYDEIFLCRRPS
jgi:trans-aconitate methyltransferase